MQGQPDPRVNAFRADLADERLRGSVAASRYIAGRAARVVVGRAPMRKAPDGQAEIVTFCHYGETVCVFDQGAGYFWCQSSFDSYVGYVAATHITPGDAPGATHFVATLGAYAYAVPDLRSPAVDFLPRHAALVVAESALATRGTAYVRLDTGLYLPSACVSPCAPRSPDIAAAAALYLGAPYLWGGRSIRGIDCSGLVQCAFRDLGVTVMRDTDLQRDTIGGAVAVEGPAELRRNDLLYMPGHVLIYAGEGGVIHADGVSMTVRHDNLAELMGERDLDFARFAVRRHPAAAG